MSVRVTTAGGEMRSDMPQAWVFNCDYNGLSVIQALGRRGVEVRALDSRRAIGTRSRYAQYCPVPDPMVDEDGFIQALWRYRGSVDANPVLIPTNDHWAETLARHQLDLAAGFECCVSGYETVSLLLDKERFGRWGQSVGLPVPRVWSVDEALANPNLPFPVAVKANSRRKSGQGVSWSRAADRLRFRPCKDQAELEAVLGEARHAGVPVFLQEVINGRSDAMRTIGLFARDGEILGLIFGEKHRGFPPRFGDCVVGIAMPAPEWALGLVQRACRELRYTGVAEFEVMVDSESKERFLIEINPRSWSWVGVTEPAGVPLAWLAFRNLAFGEGPEETQLGCPEGQSVYYAKLLADLQNTMLWYRFSDAKDWVFSPRGWWKTFSGRNGVFAEFARDDPLVALMAFPQAAKLFAVRARHVLRGKRF